MPFYDAAAQNAALDALWGSQHGVTMPDTFEVGLFTGDPSDAGLELDPDGGYARIVCANDDTTWLPADEGVKTSVLLVFPDSTGEWSDDADYFGLFVGGTLFDFGRLTDPVSVAVEGPGPQVILSRYFDPQV